MNYSMDGNTNGGGHGSQGNQGSKGGQANGGQHCNCHACQAVNHAMFPMYHGVYPQYPHVQFVPMNHPGFQIQPPKHDHVPNAPPANDPANHGNSLNGYPQAAATSPFKLVIHCQGYSFDVRFDDEMDIESVFLALADAAGEYGISGAVKRWVMELAASQTLKADDVDRDNVAGHIEYEDDMEDWIARANEAKKKRQRKKRRRRED